MSETQTPPFIPPTSQHDPYAVSTQPGDLTLHHQFPDSCFPECDPAHALPPCVSQKHAEAPLILSKIHATESLTFKVNNLAAFGSHSILKQRHWGQEVGCPPEGK